MCIYIYMYICMVYIYIYIHIHTCIQSSIVSNVICCIRLYFTILHYNRLHTHPGWGLRAAGTALLRRARTASF